MNAGPELPGLTYFLRTVPEASAPGLSNAERLRVTVNNTGNYFFEHALSRQLSDYQQITDLADLPLGVERLVLSMSNFISPSTDLGWLAEKIEARQPRQIIMVGAGAQAHGFSERIHLTPGTRRFLDMLSERSVSIGVRGRYTAEVLAGIGIHNVDVIGCPSMFYHGGRDFSIQRRDLRDRALRTAIHCTPEGYYRDAVSHLLSFGLREGACYVAQSEAQLIFDDPAMEERRKFFFQYFNDGSYGTEELRDWMKRSIRWFFDLPTWFAHMEGVDLAVGSRFHGNMAALQVGVPALNLVFDSRTRELCEYLNLPYEFLKSFDGRRSAKDIYESLDYSVFNATYPGKYDAYAAFLSRNGVAHRLEPGELPAWETQSGRVRLASLLEVIRTATAAGVPAERIAKEVAMRIEDDRGEYQRKMAEKGKYDVLSEGA